MLLAHSKLIALSTSFLLALSISATASAQFARLTQHSRVGQPVDYRLQPVAPVQAVEGQMAGACGCNSASTGSAHSGLMLCDIMHGCAFKRETAHLWDGYCEEAKSHCDHGCSPLFKGRAGCGLHGGRLDGCHSCGSAGGAHGRCAGCGLGAHGNRSLLGGAHGSDCDGACTGKTTTTTLPVVSANSGCAAGCVGAAGK